MHIHIRTDTQSYTDIHTKGWVLYQFSVFDICPLLHSIYLDLWIHTVVETLSAFWMSTHFPAVYIRLSIKVYSCSAFYLQTEMTAFFLLLQQK